MAINLTETSALDKKLKLEHLPFTNHLAGNPFADVDLSFDTHDNSKKGIE